MSSFKLCEPRVAKSFHERASRTVTRGAAVLDQCRSEHCSCLISVYKDSLGEKFISEWHFCFLYLALCLFGWSVVDFSHQKHEIWHHDAVARFELCLGLVGSLLAAKIQHVTQTASE